MDDWEDLSREERAQAVRKAGVKEGDSIHEVRKNVNDPLDRSRKVLQDWRKVSRRVKDWDKLTERRRRDYLV